MIAAHLFYEGPLVPAATARGEPFKLDGYRVEPQLKEGVVPPAGPDEECSWWWTVRNAQRRRRDELLWEGWATRSEVADIALEAVVAVKEASGAAEPKPTPKPKPKPKPTRSPTVTRSKSKAAPIDLSAVPLPDRARIEALVKRLDTPEVRAVTGRGVTAERVLGMALERGLAALEHDLGTR